MRIEIDGPYYDDTTGHTVDADLLRVFMVSSTKRTQIGHARPSDKSVLIFGNCGLTKSLQERAQQYAKEILNDGVPSWPDNRSDIRDQRPAS